MIYFWVLKTKTHELQKKIIKTIFNSLCCNFYLWYVFLPLFKNVFGNEATFAECVTPIPR